LGSGSIVSGRIASGQIGTSHLADGAVTSGDIGSGQVFTFHVASGGLLSGAVGSGQIGNAHLGSGSVLSGHVGSGQIGQFHVSSGAVTSGRLGVTGMPDGTLFLRDDFSWQAAGGGLTSGAVGSGHIASGAVQGFFGTTRHVASGTVGAFDFGSGAVADALKKLALKEGKEVGKQAVTNGLRQGFADLLTKYPALTPLGEGYEEWATKRRHGKEQLANEYKQMATGTQEQIDLVKSENPFESAGAKAAMAQASQGARQMQTRMLNTMGAGASPEAVVGSQGATNEALGSAAGSIAVGAEANKQNRISNLENRMDNQLDTYGNIRMSEFVDVTTLNFSDLFDVFL